jgi:prepilin-type N-terminal cleavage/methylation domain-containing protein
MNQHKSNGFTLIELFITLLVLAVVVTLAVPPFADFLERQRLSAQAEAISSTLSTARAESMTRVEDIEVCWNQTNAAITRRSFVLRPGQMAILSLDSPAEVMRDIAFSDEGLFIDDNDANDCVTFSPSGRFDTTTATFGFLTFGICKESGDTTDSKGVVLNATGRASTADNSDGDIINCS